MEKESDDMSEKKDENLIEDEPSRESIVELGRISENTQKNIEGDKNIALNHLYQLSLNHLC